MCKQALANFNMLTVNVLICAERRLLWEVNESYNYADSLEVERNHRKTRRGSVLSIHSFLSLIQRLAETVCGPDADGQHRKCPDGLQLVCFPQNQPLFNRMAKGTHYRVPFVAIFLKHTS